MGTRPPTGMQHFLPVKNTAMFGKLLQPKAISDSSYIKAYGDQARSGSLQRSPTDRPELDLRGKRRFAAGKDRGGKAGTGQKGEMRDHSPYHKLVDLPRSTDDNPDPLYTQKGDDNGEPEHARSCESSSTAATK